jgi:hypothetical protein
MQPLEGVVRDLMKDAQAAADPPLMFFGWAIQQLMDLPHEVRRDGPAEALDREVNQATQMRRQHERLEQRERRQGLKTARPFLSGAPEP